MRVDDKLFQYWDVRRTFNLYNKYYGRMHNDTYIVDLSVVERKFIFFYSVVGLIKLCFTIIVRNEN